MGLLQKIEWKTRKWNITFKLLDIQLRDGGGYWGFTFCELTNNYIQYSLASIEFVLPNGAERKRMSIIDWDLLFLRTPIRNWVNHIDESILWGHKPSSIERILYAILK